MRKLHEITPELALNDELWDISLPHRINTLPKEDCRAGYVYWGDGGGEVDIAICTGIDEYDDLCFQGVRETRGIYDLFTERHPFDSGGGSKGWAPIVELELAPEFPNENSAVQWLLSKEIEVVEQKVEWLMNMPAKYRKAVDYEYILERDAQKLRALYGLIQAGPVLQSHDPVFKTYISKINGRT